jgi:hypothetical protein
LFQIRPESNRLLEREANFVRSNLLQDPSRLMQVKRCDAEGLIVTRQSERFVRLRRMFNPSAKTPPVRITHVCGSGVS